MNHCARNWVCYPDSVIGHNVLNCALRYHISLDSIMITDIQPPDIIEHINANDNHLDVLPLLRELRDGTFVEP